VSDLIQYETEGLEREFNSQLEPISRQVYRAQGNQHRPVREWILKQDGRGHAVDNRMQEHARPVAIFQPVDPVRLERKIGDQVPQEKGC